MSMSTVKLPAIRACRPAWNKGRIVGQKRPLMPKHVWAIRVRLELAGRVRDLAHFNLAIDSKLRGCDLVPLKVAEVFSAGQVRERASIIQSKASRPVRFGRIDTSDRGVAWDGSQDLRGVESIRGCPCGSRTGVPRLPRRCR